MSAEADFLRAEHEDIKKTLTLINNLITRKDITEYETIALGKLLQDVYMGVERILRCQLEIRGVKVPKTESWHKRIVAICGSEPSLGEYICLGQKTWTCGHRSFSVAAQ